MSKEVKCLLCSEPFKTIEGLKTHFVEEHSIPRNDVILDRYVKLRFPKTEYDFKTFKTLLNLI